MHPVRTRFKMIVLTAFIPILLGSCNNNGGTHQPVVAGSRYAAEFRSVTIDAGAPTTLQIAVRACAGLYNRELGGSIYVQMDAQDEYWLTELNLQPSDVIDAQDFLNECVAVFPSCVRYSYADQQLLTPSVITVASAIGAVPLDVGMTPTCDAPTFDATVEFAVRNTPYLAAKYVFENYLDQTTGLAMLNPGYEIWNPTDVSNPEVTGNMQWTLIDYVFSRKLFTTFFVNGCIDSNPENEILYNIVNTSQWPMPVGVYGYNNSWMAFGGFLFEAQTQCLDSRNMGAIASETVNMSFFSTRRPSITDSSALLMNAPEEVVYDATKTYVAFVVGDGDNVSYIMRSRNEWLRQRLEDCEQVVNSCEPLTWSISPHLPYLAPDVLQWYYESSYQTGKDYFILPPSGHLYAYPTSLNEADQDRFVSETEQDASILGVSSTVHWDWFDTWPDAETHFLPKYAKTNGVIKGVFPVNVPYMFPMFTWWPDDQFYEILTGEDGGKVALFKPREWRGINNSDVYHLSPQNMANEIAAYPPGTVTWVYMTSDGGLTLQNSFMELVKLLPPNVQLVSADAAARLALSATQ